MFVGGRLRNPLNGSYGHWAKHARWARDWRERTHLAIFEAVAAGPEAVFRAAQRMDPKAPKRVTFAALVPSRFDDDNLAACCKPLRDALKDAGLIHHDGPQSGHAFVYKQKAARGAGAVHGVRIGISLLPTLEGHDEPRETYRSTDVIATRDE